MLSGNPFSVLSSRGAQEALDLVAFLSDAESRAELEQACLNSQIGRAHIGAGRIREAVAYLKNSTHAPKVLIVDVTGFDLPLSEVDALAEVCEPGVRVLVVGERQDIGLFRALLKLGVADYIVKPLNASLLMPHLDGDAPLVLGGADARSGKLVVVSGACGGVGATTLAVNLGWQLAVNDHRHVAMVDLDLHGQAVALQLDLGVLTGLMPALNNADQLDPQFLDTAMAHPHARLAVLSGELAWDMRPQLEPHQLGQLVGMLKRHHHYVVTDLPRRPGPTYAFLQAQADMRIYVLNRTLAAVRNCGRMLQIDDHGNGRTLLVLNEDRPASRGMLSAEAIETALDRKIDFRIGFQRTIPGQVDVAAKGQPLAAANAAYAQAIATIAAGVAGRRIASGGRWWRMLGRR